MKRMLEVRAVTYALEDVGEGMPLLLLHGFTGSKAVFEPFLNAWKSSFHVLAPDLLGHGDTAAPIDPNRYTMTETCEDLCEMLENLGIDQVNVLGYSMGGRIALSFACAYPGKVNRVVLEGASPGLQDPLERERRVASDESLALSIEQEGIEAFVRRWEDIPLFASQKHLPENTFHRQRSIRLRQRAIGLANSLRGVGTGRQPSLWNRLSHMSAPTLLVTGSLDTKFTEINRRMQSSLPNAQHVVIPDAGHTPHLENPETFAAFVSSFFFGHE